jgi:hypothetical protein
VTPLEGVLEAISVSECEDATINVIRPAAAPNSNFFNRQSVYKLLL